MDERYIYDWMINKKGLKESVAKTNRARIKRIDTIYNLSEAYTNDGCAYVLSLFEYSTTDAKNGLLPEHDITIEGNYYTGTQSLKYALTLYIEAMTDKDYFSVWTKVIPQSENIVDGETDEMRSAFFDMITADDAPVRKILKESKEKSHSAIGSADAVALASVSNSSTTFKGDFRAFIRYVGPFCRNYVNSIAKPERSKHNGICEYCGTTAVLDSAHKVGEERPDIIQKILETYFKISENYYEVDISKFEKIFKKSHMPVKDHIFFLCKKCHAEYDKGTRITTADIIAKRKP